MRDHILGVYCMLKTKYEHNYQVRVLFLSYLPLRYLLSPLSCSFKLLFDSPVFSITDRFVSSITSCIYSLTSFSVIEYERPPVCSSILSLPASTSPNTFFLTSSSIWAEPILSIRPTVDFLRDFLRE